VSFVTDQTPAYIRLPSTGQQDGGEASPLPERCAARPHHQYHLGRRAVLAPRGSQVHPTRGHQHLSSSGFVWHTTGVAIQELRAAECIWVRRGGHIPPLSPLYHGSPGPSATSGSRWAKRRTTSSTSQFKPCTSGSSTPATAP
jgi:hypothetical protein